MPGIQSGHTTEHGLPAQRAAVRVLSDEVALREGGEELRAEADRTCCFALLRWRRAHALTRTRFGTCPTRLGARRPSTSASI